MPRAEDSIATGAAPSGRPTYARSDVRIVALATDDLRPTEIAEIRALLDAAFGADAFSDDDWAHAIPGTHALALVGDRIAAHASVVDRPLWIRGQPVRCGYVEAVATEPSLQRRGLGTAVMRQIGRVIEDDFELGALSTGTGAFYERLGWRRWRGETWVRRAGELVRTEEDDGGVWVLPTCRMPEPDLDAPIACEDRSGDVW